MPKPSTPTYEKLGAFYLGRRYDADTDEVTPELVLYDSKDLTTHAVCVGMTGSGKTGLCVSLLEEAAIDGIPALVIDPKGDLGNLCLTFPQLRPEDFRPWIDEGEATRKGTTPDEYAAAIADRWGQGLKEWGQDKTRIRRLREAADVAIYTPGSSAGISLSVLRSFTAPSQAVVDDADAFRERVSSAVSGLLALIGVDADPVQSREHILLSNIFDRAWRRGESLDVATLIAQVQSPPFEKIGVMDLDTFFPAKDRFQLSTKLNNLVASPGFAGWMEGEALEIPRLLWTPDGRPRIAILSIAHLSDAERMFFVTIVLNEMIAWMRAQSGTTSLRALLYMDEIFGFVPPVANPPSKTPMLTLLKQARAFGVGVVLATQNPVDLDYKGLSNAGTWFLGRLQTERDKKRVLEGLEGASAQAGASFDKQKMEATLAGLKSRVFLMNNVHDDEPVLFNTRWVMSYLRGPLTRSHIQTLMADHKAQLSVSAEKPKVMAKDSGKKAPKAAVQPPVVPSDVQQFYLPVASTVPDARLVYRPALLASADLHFANARAKVDLWKAIAHIAPLRGKVSGDVWAAAESRPEADLDVTDSPEDDAEYSALPSVASKGPKYKTWGKTYKTHVYQTEQITLLKCATLKTTSTPGETDVEFKVRLRDLARERRDLAVEKLKKRYASKFTRLRDQIRNAEQRVEKEQAQYGNQKMQTAISVGATVLGAIFGRKAASVGTVGRASTAMRGAGRAAREKQDIAMATEKLEALREKLENLEAEFQQETDALDTSSDVDTLELTEIPIRPRKSDIAINRFGLLWVPFWVDADGIAESAAN